MGRRSGTASKALVRRRIRPGGGEGWRNQPKAAFPVGHAARGFWPDAEGTADMPAGRCSGDLFLRIGKSLRTTRRMPGASGPSANVWGRDGRSGVTPERAPIPALRGLAFGRRDHFGQAMGWLARKRYSRGGPGPRGMVWLVLRSIQGWRLPALRRGRASQVFRSGYDRHPQPVNPRPMPERQESPCFAYNRSPMELRIGSGKIQMVDADLESQPGRSIEDTRPRFRPNGALSCPHICPWRRVPR